MLRQLFFILFLLFTVHGLKAQDNTLSGAVLDQVSKAPISHATVLLKGKDGLVIAFKSTNDKGEFTFKVTNPLTELTLEINHLGYQKFQKQLSNSDKNLRLELQQKTIVLEDITVKSRPRIARMGDTLAYNVESFSKEEDRSIGDVLKRMPGIEVSDAGQIKYQGKSISNLYIDGDDLLEDRYSIGTRTIPHKMVKDIHVLNNHEHLKVLKNKRFSDQVAINLVIKDDAKLKLTTEAKIGLGLPKQYDVEVNNMLFNKKTKFLNVLAGNNIGQSYNGDLSGFNQKTLLSELGNSRVNNLLSLGTVGEPPIERSQYYLNNSLSVNANDLINLKNEWQLKLNLNAIYNQDETSYYAERTYFIEDDIFDYRENQETETKQFLGALRMNLNKNANKKYISNSLSLEYEKEDKTALLISNDETLNQLAAHKIRGFTYRMEYVPELNNKNVLQSNLYINYGNKPQSLSIQPGVFSSIFNDSIPYNRSLQEVEVPQFFTNYSLGYRIPKGKIKQYYDMGFSLENQNLSSSLLLEEEEGSALRLASENSINDMLWNRIRYFVTPQYEWAYKRFSSSLTMPVSIQNILYRDRNFSIDENRFDLLFNPNLRMKQRIGYEGELDFNYSFNNTFGTIENVYRGLVLKNYRTLSSNSSDINETQTHQVGLNYRVGRAIKLLFYNFGLHYAHNSMNNIVSSQVNNEIIETVLLNIENSTQSLNLNAGIDAFIFPLSSSVKLNGGFTLTDYNQLLNGNLLPFQNLTYSINPRFELKIWKGYNLSYNGTASLTQSRQTGGSSDLDRNFRQLNQSISLPFNPVKGVHVRFTARHLFTEQIEAENLNYVFADFFTRYRHPKLKTDFEFSINNIANIKNFETYSANANLISYSSYQLRGRIAMLKVVFNL
ncbi:carboxypeptidase-like regulatory domain-containing protein [Sphingobacterium hungaricum]|uniref:CarboxypepD_reg-like domain-containing protein n=1 Tax=Sphingobacterium hungaricum TaxID=2082723 RepID=A0A928YPE1_9SPHI|nr:carboxypeptidase-like regulatory domain-containing protein [Sphingobacterium hungaricum]MBE8713036.1 hypothetical protein [Sphingobacterium hungaricum]